MEYLTKYWVYKINGNDQQNMQDLEFEDVFQDYNDVEVFAAKKGYEKCETPFENIEGLYYLVVSFRDRSHWGMSYLFQKKHNFLFYTTEVS
jgi:hypothetical protein